MVELRLTTKPTGIMDLYNTIAGMLGFDPDHCRYDCTKIEVSKDVMIAIEESYDDKEIFAMHWICFGPKASEDLRGNLVAIDTGFIKEEEECCTEQ